MEYTNHCDEEHGPGIWDRHVEQPGGALIGFGFALAIEAILVSIFRLFA